MNCRAVFPRVNDTPSSISVIAGITVKHAIDPTNLYHSESKVTYHHVNARIKCCKVDPSIEQK